jgi:hypothetical protein
LPDCKAEPSAWKSCAKLLDAPAVPLEVPSVEEAALSTMATKAAVVLLVELVPDVEPLVELVPEAELLTNSTSSSELLFELLDACE